MLIEAKCDEYLFGDQFSDPFICSDRLSHPVIRMTALFFEREEPLCQIALIFDNFVKNGNDFAGLSASYVSTLKIHIGPRHQSP